MFLHLPYESWTPTSVPLNEPRRGPGGILVGLLSSGTPGRPIRRSCGVTPSSLRDNRYCCLDLTDSRSTAAARTTSNAGACPVVPPSHCGYQQGEPSPYLVSRHSRRARLP